MASYHYGVRGVTPPPLEAAFVGFVFALVTVSVSVEGLLESPLYSLVGGLGFVLFGGVLITRGRDGWVLTAVGAGFLGYGVYAARGRSNAGRK